MSTEEQFEAINAAVLQLTKAQLQTQTAIIELTVSISRFVDGSEAASSASKRTSTA